MASPEQGASESQPADPQEQSPYQGQVSPTPEAGDMSTSDGIPAPPEEQSPSEEAPADGSEAAPLPPLTGWGMDPPGTHHVNDVEKAHTMALAEDDFRTKAVQNRALTEEPQQVLQKVKRTLHGKKAGRQAEKQFLEDFPDEVSPVFLKVAAPNAYSRAHFYDEQASRIGDWAGKLHDHPLSEQFKTMYPEVDVSPKSLVRFEDDAQRLEREIRVYEARHAYGETPDISGTDNAVTELLAKADPEQAKRWQDINERLQANQAEADTFYKELLEEVEIQPRKNRLALTRNLLHNVEREVGGQPEPGAEQAESSD